MTERWRVWFDEDDRDNIFVCRNIGENLQQAQHLAKDPATGHVVWENHDNDGAEFAVITPLAIETFVAWLDQKGHHGDP